MGILDGVPVYELFERVSDNGTLEKVNYFFISEGERFVIKVVEFTYIGVFSGESLYNFGFGDLNEESGNIIDDRSTQNGDVVKVFQTVLSTLPLFFLKNPKAIVVVRGSDSRPEYISNCKKTCKKGCLNGCKKAGQRLRVYHHYIHKNWEMLAEEFQFWGGDFDKYGIEDRVKPWDLSETYNCIYVGSKN